MTNPITVQYLTPTITSVSATAAATTFLSFTIAANTMADGDQINAEWRAKCTYSASAVSAIPTANLYTNLDGLLTDATNRLNITAITGWGARSSAYVGSYSISVQEVRIYRAAGDLQVVPWLADILGPEQIDARWIILTPASFAADITIYFMVQFALATPANSLQPYSSIIAQYATTGG